MYLASAHEVRSHQIYGTWWSILPILLTDKVLEWRYAATTPWGSDGIR
jgi:hypothetical protein